MKILPNKKQIDNSYLLSFIFRTYTKLKSSLISDEDYAKKYFKKKFNRELNLQKPETFNEKLQWLKLNDRTPLHTLCADKIAVHEYVKEKIGEKYLIPLVRTFSNASELTVENLPEYPVIIKCNHNSAAYTIVKDKNKIDWKKERLKFSNLLKQNYYYQGREWQYKDIEPKILVEKLLFDSKGNVPNDNRFFCFHGKPQTIQIDTVRKGVHLRSFFDAKWNLLPYEMYYKTGGELEKPKQLELMLKLASKLSEDFLFARVDFYSLGDEVYFGEITFHPRAGFGVFNDIEYDKEMGNHLSLEKI